MLRIGEAARFYDEEDVLKPSYVDPSSGFRHYSRDDIEKGCVVRFFRECGIPVAQLRGLFGANRDDGAGMPANVQKLVADLSDKISALSEQRSALLALGELRSSAGAVPDVTGIETITAPRQVFVGQRTTGPLVDAPGRMTTLYLRHRSKVARQPLLLQYDSAPNAASAEYAVCLPLRQNADVDIAERIELAGGPRLRAWHRGHPSKIATTYSRMQAFAESQLACVCNVGAHRELGVVRRQDDGTPWYVAAL